MTEFNWHNESTEPIKVRTLLAENGVTRSLLKEIKYHGGLVEVNGVERRVNESLQKGDWVRMVLPPEPANDVISPSDLPLDILFEDEHFLVVNKPASVASVPSHIYARDTLVNRVKGYYVRQAYENQVTHIVTRLDRETSGVVLFAKHHLAHSVLDLQLKKHQLKKTYLAVVEGQLKKNHDIINTSIGRAPNSFIKRQVVSEGKKSITEYWRIKQMPAATLLRLQLHTGRTHQIRVHMQSIGHPLIGDWLYGSTSNPWIKRQALHCLSVTFYNPFSKQVIKCVAPIPVDMATLITKESEV
ncbi:hypothetical protein C5L31_001224 [Secundilactobacillus malefermentans]|uniref:Pseudouridine synthase n=1 Tax=Secundilactobacillus malefermentans TaxID=176292 RepID=A0A4R5NTI5_9LACO|nr:RluA family pseudouridine synthase [Secundilactobacillus malefermentans]KRM58518.1 RluA family pseudouridine synthase [Secundilactobacillus malefermentans DSM 5705 = KCTC 3548]TDG80648.1 hypothetical protein C5L31_001224 [Secundilactobacillus malefermentans]